MKGTLEGLESNYESEGLGARAIEFDALPEAGRRFRCLRASGAVRDGTHNEAHYELFATGTVQSVRRLAENRLGFRTKRTTYILVVEPE